MAHKVASQNALLVVFVWGSLLVVVVPELCLVLFAEGPEGLHAPGRTDHLCRCPQAESWRRVSRRAYVTYPATVCEQAAEPVRVHIQLLLVLCCCTVHFNFLLPCSAQETFCSRCFFCCHSTMCLHRVVEYANREDMKNAIRKLDGTELNGRRLRLVEERVGSRHRRYNTPPLP